MLYHLEQYISNSLTAVFEPAYGQRVNYTANTGTCLISTANTALNGTGTIATLITGAGNGTLVRTITITATQSTTRGMVRLFLQDDEPTFTKLIAEIDIPERTISSADKAFHVVLKVDFMLKSTYSIRASTEKAEGFRLVAEGLDTSFP